MNSRLPALLIACGIASATAFGASEGEAQRLARYAPYAGAPIARADNFDLLRYEMTGPSHVVVWSKRPGDVYLLTFREPCRELDFSGALALRTEQRSLRAGIDFVQARGRSCFIDRIQPIDEHALRAAKQG